MGTHLPTSHYLPRISLSSPSTHCLLPAVHTGTGRDRLTRAACLHALPGGMLFWWMTKRTRRRARVWQHPHTTTYNTAADRRELRDSIGTASPLALLRDIFRTVRGMEEGQRKEGCLHSVWVYYQAFHCFCISLAGGWFPFFLPLGPGNLCVLLLPRTLPTYPHQHATPAPPTPSRRWRVAGLFTSGVQT